MEDVWRDILSSHTDTLDFATYTPQGDMTDSDEDGSGSFGSGPATDAEAEAEERDVLIRNGDLHGAGSASSGGDRMGSSRGASERKRDAVRRRAKRVGSSVKAASKEVTRAAMHLTKSFTEYKAIAGDSFVDARRLTKVANLGAGAFANVEWAVLRRPGSEDMNVAVKRLRHDLISSDQDLQDFVREGALLKRLHHPSIVDFVGLGFRTDRTARDGVSADSLFIVQEFMNGGTLKLMVLEQMVAHHKVVYSFTDALRWMTQIAEGLAYLHANRPAIVHRDLKLENILLTEGADGVLNAKLADFGLHAIVDASDRNETVRKIKRLASSVLSEEAATRALGGLEGGVGRTDSLTPAGRLDSLLSVSGPSVARMPDAFRRAALGRSVSAGADQIPVPHAAVAKRSVSAAAHSSVMAYRPSRLGRSSGSKLQEAPQSPTAADPAKAEPGRGNGGGSGSITQRKSSSGSALSGASSGESLQGGAAAQARLNRAAGERGSRIWQRLASNLGTGPGEGGLPKHDLTGQTGSFMYMAPEVMMSKTYNEKVDVFSFGIILFEVFAKSHTGAALLTVGDMDECEMYAWKVAHGYRRPIPSWWPAELAALVVRCWGDDPDSRPSAAELVRQLRALAGAVASMDSGSDARCCCCIM